MPTQYTSNDVISYLMSNAAAQYASQGGAAGGLGRKPIDGVVDATEGRLYNEVPLWQDQARTHQQKTDYLARSSALTNVSIKGLISTYPQGLTSSLLPVRPIPRDASGQMVGKLEFVEQQFNRVVWDELPEESVPRLVHAQSRVRRQAIRRYGLAVMAELTALETAAGLADFENSLRSIAVSGNETLTLQALQAIVDASMRSNAFGRKYEGGDPVVAAKYSAQVSMSLQKSYVDFINVIKNMMKEIRYNSPAGSSPDMVVHDELLPYLSSSGRERGALDGVNLRTELFGPGELIDPTNGLAPVAVFNGVRIWGITEPRNYNEPHNNAHLARVTEVLTAVRRAAEYYVADNDLESYEVYDGVDNTDQSARFTSDDQAIVIFSYQHGSFVKISRSFALAAANAGNEPAPKEAPYTSPTAEDHGRRRRVPWNHVYNVSTNEFFKARTFGPLDRTAVDDGEYQLAARTMLAAIASAIGAKTLVQSLNDSNEIYDMLASRSILDADGKSTIALAGAIAKLGDADPVTTSDPENARKYQWHGIMQHKANPVTGTINLSDYFDAADAAASFPPAPTFGGLKAAATQIATVDVRMQKKAKDTVQFWERLERVLLNKITPDNSLLSLAHSVNPKVLPGSRAFSVFYPHAVPVFARSGVVAAANPDGSAYIIDISPNFIGQVAVGNPRGFDAQVRELLEFYNAGAVKPYNSSHIYGANRLVAVRSNGKTAIMPAALAYTLVYFDPMQFIAESVTEDMLPWVSQISAAVGRNENLDVIGSLNDDKKIRGLVGYIHSRGEGQFVNALNEIEEAYHSDSGASSSSSAGKRKKGKGSLDALVATGLEHAQQQGIDVNAARALKRSAVHARFNTEALYNDYVAWFSQTENATASFPFPTARTSEESLALHAELARIVSQLPNAEAADAATEVAAKNAGVGFVGQGGFRDAAYVFPAATAVAGYDAQRAINAVQAGAAGTGTATAGAASQFIRVPWALSAKQWREWQTSAAAQALIRPADPESGYAQPIRAGSSIPDDLMHVGTEYPVPLDKSDAFVGARFDAVAVSQGGSGASSSTMAVGSDFGSALTTFRGQRRGARSETSQAPSGDFMVDGHGKQTRILRLSALAREVSSDEFRRRLAQITLPHKALDFALLLFMTSAADEQGIHNLLDNKVYVPIHVLIVRLRLSYAARAAMLALGGSGLGASYLDDVRSTMAINGVRRTAQLTATARMAATVTNPSAVAPVLDVALAGLIGGHGVDVESVSKHPLVHGHLNSKGSLVFTTLAASEVANFAPRGAIGVTGQFPFSSPEPRERGLHYGSASLLDHWYKLSDRLRSVNSAMASVDRFSDYGFAYPTIALRGTWISSAGRGRRRLNRGISHLSQANYPGAKPLLDGAFGHLDSFDDQEARIANYGIHATLIENM